MKIEVGKWYVRRSGVPVNIVRETKGILFPFLDDTKTSYQSNGKYFEGEGIHANDLIREWVPDVGCELVKPEPTLFDRMKVAGFKMPLTSPQIDVTVPTPQPEAQEAPRPHKHAAAIKAWADGKTVEYKGPNMTEWKVLLPAGSSMALWKDDVEYRVKQDPIVIHFVLFKNHYNGTLAAPGSYDKEISAFNAMSERPTSVGMLTVTFDRTSMEPTDYKFKKKETQ